jgi:hypothetical protein
MHQRVSVRGSWTIGRAILLGTLAVGVLDGIDAVVFSAFRGVSPMRLFQAIAFSLLGRDTYGAGLSSALLGLAIHFCVAFGIVSVYVVVSRWIRALREYPFVFGPLYGIAAWLVMNFVVLPLTLIGHPRLAWPSVINGILIHMFGVGLPAALAAAKIRSRA